MPIYAYQAQSINGKKTRGDLEAIDIEDAKLKIRQQQLIPLQVVQLKNTYARKEKSATFLQLLFAPKVKTRDLQVFTRQFATLINAGITAGDSLKILETGTGNPLLRQVIRKVRISVEAGKNLGDSMAAFPITFDNFYCNMIRAGEASGSLDNILNRMAVYLEKNEKVKNQVKSAMSYPVLILALTAIVVSGILVFVIPKFQEMYTSSGSDLPQLTQMIIALSYAIRSKWYFLVLLFFAGPSILVAYYNTGEGKKLIDKIFIDSPLFGDLIVKSSVARFSRTMSTLLSSGVPLLEAIEAAAKTVGNVIIENTLNKCRESVAVGKGFALPLSKLKILPPMVGQMVSIGEHTGALDSMLSKVADFYEDEVENVIKSMTSLIEPLMLVIIGCIIAVILIAMYLPIFGMADAVTRGG